MAKIALPKEVLELGDSVMIHYIKQPRGSSKKVRYHGKEGVVIEIKEYVDPPGPDRIYTVEIDDPAEDPITCARHELQFFIEED